MTYAFTQDVPIDSTTYERIVDALGAEVPAGLLVHLAIVRPEGGLRYIDVWEAETDFARFADRRLHPVVHPMLAGMFGEASMPAEPERNPVDVIHIWHP